MAIMLSFFTLFVLLFDSYSAHAESVSGTAPKFDSLRDMVQELNESVRGNESVQSKLSRDTSPERVARGAKLYRENCIQCHGEGGVGALNWHRPDASGNYPPPPLNGSAHTWHHPKAQLLDIIRNGSTVMPAFKSKLEDNDIDDIIHWFQSLWPDELYRAWARQNEAFERSTN